MRRTGLCLFLIVAVVATHFVVRSNAAPPPESDWDNFVGIKRGDTADDVKKVLRDPEVQAPTNPPTGLRYFQGALLVHISNQTNKVDTISIKADTEPESAALRAGFESTHISDPKLRYLKMDIPHLRKEFGKKLERFTWNRGANQRCDYEYSPRTMISFQYGVLTVRWNDVSKK
jgi:hypothetical protein